MFRRTKVWPCCSEWVWECAQSSCCWGTQPAGLVCQNTVGSQEQQLKLATRSMTHFFKTPGKRDVLPPCWFNTTVWTCSYLAFGSGGRLGCPPSSACLDSHCSVGGSSSGAGSSSPVSSWSPPAALRGCWNAGGVSLRSGTARSAAGASWPWVLWTPGNTTLAGPRRGPQPSQGW